LSSKLILWSWVVFDVFWPVVRRRTNTVWLLYIFNQCMLSNNVYLIKCFTLSSFRCKRMHYNNIFQIKGNTTYEFYFYKTFSWNQNNKHCNSNRRTGSIRIQIYRIFILLFYSIPYFVLKLLFKVWKHFILRFNLVQINYFFPTIFRKRYKKMSFWDQKNAVFCETIKALCKRT